jgi:hypothetical protein
METIEKGENGGPRGDFRKRKQIFAIIELLSLRRITGFEAQRQRPLTVGDRNDLNTIPTVKGHFKL